MPRNRDSVELAVGLNGHRLQRRLEPQPWAPAAACRDLDKSMFFPTETGAVGRDQVAAARAVCDTCPVRFECLQAGWSEEHGIWGGTTERQRRALRAILRRLQPGHPHADVA